MAQKFDIRNSALNDLFNFPAGSEIFAVIALAKKANGGMVHVCRNDMYMEKAANLLRFFSPDLNILQLPAWDTNPYDRVSPNSNIVSKRLETLSQLKGGLKKGTVLLTTANALLQKLPPAKFIAAASLEIKPGQVLKREELLEFLVGNSYMNVASATDHGEFAVRGSIIDICPPSAENGIRLDFIGDEVESIRKYDPLTQISLGAMDSFRIIPASEVPLDKEHIQRFRESFAARFGAGACSRDAMFGAVSEGRRYAGFENYLALFHEKMETLFDHCGDATFCLEPDVTQVIEERQTHVKDAYNARVSYASTGKYGISDHYLPPEEMYVMPAALTTEMKGRTVVQLHKFGSANEAANTDYSTVKNYWAESKAANTSPMEVLKDELLGEITVRKTKKNLIACMSAGSRDRMQAMLKEHDIDSVFVEAADEAGKKIALCVLPLDSGFEAEGVRVISEADLLGEKIFRRRNTKGRKAEDFIREAGSLTTGELVVHAEHGIGRFTGLETLTIQNVSHDFILLEYHGGDKLYVPVENIELISRYGSNEEGAELDKLGGLHWQERTARIRSRIKVVAEELIKTAAEREIKGGKIFDHEGGAYDEFCARFPYAETEDQENAIEEVLKDLSSGKTMDRLICGDVGFGKTEVALRAAFAIVQNNIEGSRKQVAVICPTTLLCRQHYNTFVERFAGTGIVIRQLSRMVTATEMKKIRKAIEEGEVDIVIGTHALLAENLKFNDLSLMVIDEEQRFGVAQKERLEKLRANTHVLTLTATPIPRTLQLSLSGIRDLSLIATPPVDRLAVRTFVMPYDEITVREAILKEHYRGGRCYFVVPRITDLEEVSKKLRELVPEVRIVTAHGRMKPDELDDIMNDFDDGRFDVLLATTIVESGLDISAANTIIIYRADMFGLAQLYQLRGRVGRSKQRAYAYLTVPPRKTLTRQAEKRLEVMQKLDTLGAGFTLASYDMDIRGFGNLLGEEQSGNIKEVGVELYQSMLREAIEGLSKEKNEDKPQDDEYSIKLNLGISVLIPEAYVADADLRMGLYRRLGMVKDDGEVESFAAELRDRFGVVPPEVDNLMQTMKIRFICKRLDVEKLDAGERGASLQFRNNRFSDPDALIRLIGKNPVRYKIKDGTKFVIANMEWKDETARIAGLKKALTDIESFVYGKGQAA